MSEELYNAKAAAERFERIETSEQARAQIDVAVMYAAIAQAQALEHLANVIESTLVRGELNVMLMNGQH